MELNHGKGNVARYILHGKQHFILVFLLWLGRSYSRWNVNMWSHT